MSDDGEGVVTDFGTRVIGTDDVARIDLIFRDELIDVDRTYGFQRDVLKVYLVTSTYVSRRLAHARASTEALRFICIS
jgi:hypothetical protein